MSIDLREEEFSISIVSRLFFNQTPHWLRYQERRGPLSDVNGNPIGHRKGNRSLGGDRAYTLADIRKLAFALYRAGILDVGGLTNCQARIESMYQPVFKRKKVR